MVPLPASDVAQAVEAALAEDLGSGDVTTLATVPETAMCRAEMRARHTLTVAGLAFAVAAFRQLSSSVQLECLAADGQTMSPGDVLLRIHGPARPILSAERVALNFVQRLSGIATLTSCYVTTIAGTRARILDTRKTTPGWRKFEKYAVTCGGGANHRFGLYDRVLIKDNHLVALREAQPNAVAAAVARARAFAPGLLVEVEADTLHQASQAAEAGADIILLDNFTPAQLREAVLLIAGRSQIEASGGVNLTTVRPIAETDVDFISVGAITHSAPAVDIGLDFLSP